MVNLNSVQKHTNRMKKREEGDGEEEVEEGQQRRSRRGEEKGQEELEERSDR